MNVKTVTNVADFAVDSLSLHCHNGMIEKFWRYSRAQSAHFRQHLGPLTKERLGKYQWNKGVLKSMGFE